MTELKSRIEDRILCLSLLGWEFRIFCKMHAVLHDGVMQGINIVDTLRIRADESCLPLPKPPGLWFTFLLILNTPLVQRL